MIGWLSLILHWSLKIVVKISIEIRNDYKYFILISCLILSCIVNKEGKGRLIPAVSKGKFIPEKWMGSVLSHSGEVETLSNVEKGEVYSSTKSGEKLFTNVNVIISPVYVYHK